MPEAKPTGQSRYNINIFVTNNLVNESLQQDTRSVEVPPPQPPPPPKQVSQKCKKLPPLVVPPPHHEKQHHKEHQKNRQQSGHQSIQNGVVTTVTELPEYKCSGCEGIFVPTDSEPHCPTCCGGRCRQQAAQQQAYTQNPFMVQSPVLVQSAYSPAPNVTFVPGNQQYVFEQSLFGRYVDVPSDGPIMNRIWVPGHADELYKMPQPETVFVPSGYRTMPVQQGGYWR